MVLHETQAGLERRGMETMKRTQGTGGGPPYWVITRSGNAPTRRRDRSNLYRDVLTLDTGGGRVLPLFGSEEEASTFAELYVGSGEDSEWSPTQAWSGELLMLLSASGSNVGPCAGVEAVAFDPPREYVQGEHERLQTLGRQCFMDQLLGRGNHWWRGR